MRRFWSVLVLLFCAGGARAQSVSPVIVEYQEKARGRFELTNDNVVPLNVVLEAHSFSVDAAGKATFRALDPDIRLKLSATSFRLAPRQTYIVFYEASAAKLPAWFCIYSYVSGTTTQEGIKIVLELPHTVYLLPKKALVRDAIVVLRSGLSDDRKQVQAELENRGQDFGRVQWVEVISASGKKEYPGFPLFPGQKRVLQLDWDQPAAPEKIVLQFAKFKVEQRLRGTSTTP